MEYDLGDVGILKGALRIKKKHVVKNMVETDYNPHDNHDGAMAIYLEKKNGTGDGIVDSMAWWWDLWGLEMGHFGLIIAL